MSKRIAPLLLRAAQANGSRTAVVDADAPSSSTTGVGRTHRYDELLHRSAAIARQVAPLVKPDNLGRQPRLAFLAPRDSSYVVSQFAAWQAGAIAVPLADAQPPAEWEYVLRDAAPAVMLADHRMAAQATAVCAGLNVPLVLTDVSKDIGGKVEAAVLSPSSKDDGAIFIYTSGTTGKPKGVVHTHGSIEAQIAALVETWRWTSSDRILNILPLHHVHGVVNVVACALSVGATVDMRTKFAADQVWEALCHDRDPLTLFMAVPTVYVKLIEHFRKQPTVEQERLKAKLRRAPQSLRLMVSGSAALPLSVLKQWREITGFHLLERYGMTEFGMALSNYIETRSEDSSVGFPLPGVQCRLVDETERVVTSAAGVGELQVKGANMFREYWGRPDATKESFTEDGWFKTGDIVARGEDGRHYIRGRMSMDILKSGGYKLSALEIERELLEHPLIAECIVLGVPDDVYGERVAAVVVPHEAAMKSLPKSIWSNQNVPLSGKESSSSPELRAWAEAHFPFREWAAERLAPYKVPSIVRLVQEIPRNAMGKVNKKQVLKQLF